MNIASPHGPGPHVRIADVVALLGDLEERLNVVFEQETRRDLVLRPAGSQSQSPPPTIPFDIEIARLGRTKFGIEAREHGRIVFM
ncbi:MAG: hypothetical protein CL790_07595 [Chloroflexi bacterium]|nr:hypothetical protein [Chloroflexota bacterium]